MTTKDFFGFHRQQIAVHHRCGLHQDLAQRHHGYFDRKAARQLLVDRLDSLARKYGFTYNRVFIRNQKTRWGSCSTKNNINLNVNLVRLPAELIDYTILHELVHTRVKNHSQKFWAQMDRLLGDAKKIDKKLRAYEFLLI